MWSIVAVETTAIKETSVSAGPIPAPVPSICSSEAILNKVQPQMS